MMRLYISWIFLFEAGSALASPMVIEDLHSFLIHSQPPVLLKEISMTQGCGPAGCSANIADININRDTKKIHFNYKVNIALKTHVHNPPEMDWDPNTPYLVGVGKQRWGMCIEFSHEGLGKSGRFQRWSSVVLLPWKGERPAAQAHRFVGYRISCNDLYEGDRLGEVVLPVIEHVENDKAPLRFVRWHCSAKGCREEVDPRPISFVPDSESGALSVGE